MDFLLRTSRLTRIRFLAMFLFLISPQLVAESHPFWSPDYRPAVISNGKNQCPNLLNRAVVREVFSVLYSKQDLLRFLSYYQQVGRNIASAQTAFSPSEYQLTSPTNPEALRGHCGAMVWFLQRRFGGQVVLKQFVTRELVNGSPLEMWHLHLTKVPYRNEKGQVSFMDVDLTKSQFQKVKDNFLPLKDDLFYEGRRYVHIPGVHFLNSNYLWDRDGTNPPRPQLEEFAVRLETAGAVQDLNLSPKSK